MFLSRFWRLGFSISEVAFDSSKSDPYPRQEIISNLLHGSCSTAGCRLSIRIQYSLDAEACHWFYHGQHSTVWVQEKELLANCKHHRWRGEKPVGMQDACGIAQHLTLFKKSFVMVVFETAVRFSGERVMLTDVKLMNTSVREVVQTCDITFLRLLLWARFNNCTTRMCALLIRSADGGNENQCLVSLASTSPCVWIMACFLFQKCTCKVIKEHLCLLQVLPPG